MPSCASLFMGQGTVLYGCCMLLPCASQITFRRVLLNKCQEEFEEGDAAMKAVDAREKAAAATEAENVRPSLPYCAFCAFPNVQQQPKNGPDMLSMRPDCAQGVRAAKDDDKEDGELGTDDAAAELLQKKIDDRDAAAAELKARARG
jgi:hypothetical protein